MPVLNRRAQVIVVVALVAIALASIFGLGPHFSSPDAYTSTINALDEKKDTVMTLTGASTGTSAAVTLLPGDIGTPIAEKLVDLSSDFLIVIAAIYLEKYLLTVLGFVAFYILVPAGCLMLVGWAVCTNLSWRRGLFSLGVKLVIFGVAISVVVPASVGVSRMIESTYKASIDQTVKNAQDTAEKIEKEAKDEGEDKGTGNIITDLVDTVTGGANQLAESARNSLNDFIESLAVMIVTSCIIPVLVLLAFVWLLRVLFGINIEMPKQLLRPRTLGPHRRKRTP